MKQKVLLEQKKAFIKWFVGTYKLRRRESLWILDYLANHDIVLDRTHFVENVKATPRGIKMGAAHTQGRSFLFYKNGVEYEDPEKAFHEIRMNWHEPLFLEVDFPEAFLSPLYVKVLEDNPYAKWNDLVPENIRVMANDAIDEFQLTTRKEELIDDIDDALAKEDKERFIELSDELIEIEQSLAELKMNH